MTKNIVKIIMIPLEGFSNAVSSEATRYKLSIVQVENDFLIAEGKSSDVAEFIVSSLTSKNVMIFLGKMDLSTNSFDASEGLVDFLKVKEFTFKVVSENASREDCIRIGKLIENEYGLKANLENPDLNFGLVKCNSNDFFIGINPYKKEYSKRDYRVYPSKQSANPLLYASLFEVAGVKNNHSFLDPLCQDGSFAIEYVLRTTRTVRMHENHLLNKDLISFFFDLSLFENKSKEIDFEVECSDEQMNNLAKAKQNSRLAGVERNIAFARVPVQYLVLKHEPKSIGLIATKLPLLSKLFDKKRYESLASRVSKSANKMLRKNHKIIIISNETEIIRSKMEEYGFDDFMIYEYAKGESSLFGIVATSKGALK